MGPGRDRVRKGIIWKEIPMYFSYGAAAGVVSVPPDTKCEPIKEGCEMKWVYRDNRSKECAKEDMP